MVSWASGGGGGECKWYIDVEYVNTPNTSQYVGPAQTRMIHVVNTCIAVTIRHDDCSSIIYGTSESFVTVIKEPSTIRN